MRITAAIGSFTLFCWSIAMLAWSEVVSIVPDGREWMLGASLGLMFCAGLFLSDAVKGDL